MTRPRTPSAPLLTALVVGSIIITVLVALAAVRSKQPAQAPERRDVSSPTPAVTAMPPYLLRRSKSILGTRQGAIPLSVTQLLLYPNCRYSPTHFLLIDLVKA